ncbi:hypothetical protein GCM10023217_32970 [Gordonia alkaliphila]|uniref:Uncharacterized protein n=1 Tax=Gordonia alkaliphila TaxID=1053547 RepID=A0ABP8ZJP8_9ACTN
MEFAQRARRRTGSRPVVGVDGLLNDGITTAGAIVIAGGDKLRNRTCDHEQRTDVHEQHTSDHEERADGRRRDE